MKQATAFAILDKHNIVLEDFHGRALHSFLDGSRSKTLAEVALALTAESGIRHSPKGRLEIIAELRRRAWHNDEDALKFFASQA